MTPVESETASASSAPARDDRFFLDRFLRPSVPAKRVAALRIFIGTFAGVYTLIRIPGFAGVARFGPHEFSPAGPVKLLSAPLPPSIVYASIAITLALAVPFVVGWRYRLVAPAFAASFLWITSYRSSFGFLFHTENLAALHLVVLAMSDAAAEWSFDARRGPTKTPLEGPRYGWSVKLISMITVATYVLAGVAKLRQSGLHWISGDILTNQIAYDNLRKAVLGDSYSPIGAVAIRHAWIMKPLAAVSIVVEIGAPMALFGPRIAKLWSFFAYGFHVGVAALMAILFPYPIFGIAFLSFLEPERLLERGRAFWVRRFGKSRVAADEVGSSAR